MTLKNILLFESLFLMILFALAQKRNVPELTIEDKMKGNDFIGHLPSNVN